jgi:hypothetical protein
LVEFLPGSDGRCGPTNGPQCSSCKERSTNTIKYLVKVDSKKLSGINIRSSPSKSLPYI